MTTRILLEYPSASPVTRVLNDLTELARAEGPVAANVVTAAYTAA